MFNKIANFFGYTKRLTEAAGNTAHSRDEPGFRKITVDSDRDLNPLSHDRMLETAVYLWRSNPIANRLIELPIAYMLAEGLTISCKDPEAQSYINAFWDHPINCMDIKLTKKVREMALYGMQCWPAFVHEVNGDVQLGYLDPMHIDHVVMDPDNSEQPIGVVTKRDNKGRYKKYRIIVNGPETVFGKRTQQIRDEFSDGECFYNKVNDLSNTSKGTSDLLAVADWVDGYDQTLFSELDRWDDLKSFIWDVTLNGLDQDQIDERAKNFEKPARGSVRIHNETEVWGTETPDLKAYDVERLSRVIRNHILAGATIPEHWVGGGGDVNRATGENMHEPTFKIFAMRQQTFKHILEEVLTYVIRAKYKAYGLLDLVEAEWENYKPTVDFPEMNAKDVSKYAAAFTQILVGIGVALDRGLLTEDTALGLIATLAGRMGVDIDPEQELALAKAAAADMKKQQADEDSFKGAIDGGDDAE